MSDTIDENADVTPSEDPADATPEDPRASDGSTNAAPGGEAPADETLTSALPVAEEPAAAQPTAGGAPAMAQAAMTVPPQQSRVHGRWVRIVGAAAAAIVLLLGGAAIGSALEGQGDRDGLAAFGDRGQLRQDGAGRGGWMDSSGHMDDRGAQMAPRGGGGLSPGCDDDDCPQLGAPQTPATP